MMPKSEKPTNATTIADASNERFLKKPSGTIGFLTRDSQTTKATSSTAAAPSQLSVYVESHGWVFVLIRP